MSDWPDLEKAKKVVEHLMALSDGTLAPEILRLDRDTTSIVIDVEGVDYIFTMTVVPRQRQRLVSRRRQ